MASIFDRREPWPWSRGQRFQLTPAGTAAEAMYVGTVVAARAVPGRAAFDAACAEWAGSHGLYASDGLYLGELKAGPRTIAELIASLEACGATAAEVRTGVSRLAGRGLLEPLPPPADPLPPARRW